MAKDTTGSSRGGVPPALALGALIAVGVAMLVVALTIGGGDPQQPEGQPLRIFPVVDQVPGACPDTAPADAFPAPDRGGCYLMDTGRAVVMEGLRDVSVEHNATGDWNVLIDPRPEDAQALSRLTAELVRESGDRRPLIALVVDGTVVAAPALTEALPPAAFRIGVGGGRDEADRLADALGHG
ncbi:MULTISPECIES: hypothetical protein [unclassified Streptomyces]|uniref:SecDF P1 head subdomain-containing protein n=1 Tax=unclassified Streptomyces TaxID=2593676 RepID=UPI000CD5192F|nr:MULTISPECIES: hypothetical protein [unclassified Streptomyces]